MVEEYKIRLHQYQKEGNMEAVISQCKEALCLQMSQKDKFSFLYTLSKALNIKKDYKASAFYGKCALDALNIDLDQAIEDNEVWYGHMNWLLALNYQNLEDENLTIKYALVAYRFFKAMNDEELVYTMLLIISLALKSIDSWIDSINKLDEILKNEDNYIDEITQYYLKILPKLTNIEDFNKILNNINNKDIKNELAKKGVIPLK